MRVQVVSQTRENSFVRPDVCLGCISNISQGGAKLWLPCQVPKDKLWIRFATTAEAGELIECDVRWRTREQDVPRSSMECGVQFSQAMDLTGMERILCVERSGARRSPTRAAC
jgi:hypothetical protein